MSRRAELRHAGRRPTLLVPWLAYLALTIVGPALNGAWRRPDFAAHALLTFAVSGAVLGFISAARRMCR